MNTYSDNISSNNMEDVRGYIRRCGRHDSSEYSHQSVLSAIGDLVKSITTMDETILVPCRLMDLKVGEEQDLTAPKKHINKNKNTIQDILCSADLFDVYSMLNSIKVDLLWGQSLDVQTPAAGCNSTVPSNTSQKLHLIASKGHVRRPSTVSVASTNSSASIISDSESEAGNENDSGIEEPLQIQDQTELLAQNFRRHLKGLTRCLRQMSDAAQYLTTRYQHDIGGSPL